MSEPSPRPGWSPADLHRRLAARDPLAPAEFAAAFLDPLVAHLRAKYPHADDHLLVEAAEDALLSVIHNPAVFDPAHDLPTFLRMAARGDLLNRLTKERRHQNKREDRNCVELEADAGNSSSEDDDLSFDDPRLAPVVAALSEADRRVLDLMRDGERRTGAFAAALGIAGLPLDEQQREVKRVKDRILVRLRRAGGGA